MLGIATIRPSAVLYSATEIRAPAVSDSTRQRSAAEDLDHADHCAEQTAAATSPRSYQRRQELPELVADDAADLSTASFITGADS
jgi:hypothetical protein